MKLRTKLYAAALLCLLSLFVVALVWREQGPVVSESPVMPLRTEIVGVVEHPRTDLPVSGVVLAVADTVITTEESGQFRFRMAESVGEIRMEHPEVTQPFVISLGSEAGTFVSILFDSDLYNQLVTILEAESVKSLVTIYETLAPTVTEQLSLEQFIAEYHPLYTAEETLVGPIVVTNLSESLTAEFEYNGNTLIFRDVITIELQRSQTTQQYSFVFSNDSWRLVGITSL